MNEFVVIVDGQKKIARVEDNIIIINDTRYTYEIHEKVPQAFVLRLNSKLHTIVKISNSANPIDLLIDGNYFQCQVMTRLEDKAREITSQLRQDNLQAIVTSPMPGMVLKIKKNIGDEVAQDEPLLILEAMKMENEVRSPRSGKIKQIFITEKTGVEKGQKLIIIE
jgi:biotin carboxyl carrier protein